MFSEAVSVTPEAMRNHALTVTGGAVTGAARVDGQSGVWQITVTPSTRGELSIYLDPTTDCEATGAVCPSDNRALSTWFLHLLLGPPTGLSVSDAETRESEDTTLDFVVTLSPAASGQVTVDYATSDGTATAGADYTATDGTLTFEAGEATKTISVPITDDTAEDDGETVSLALSNASGAELGDSQATGTIRDMESDPALTASFEDVPASHDGKTAFTFGLTFSADVEGLSFRTLRDEAFEVTGGELRRARRRTKGSNQAWDITVNPASDGAVTIRLPQTTDCEATGAVCTADDRPLPTALSAAVSGPVGISVADARVEEGAGAVLAFAVTLSRAASGTVAVDYETSDGSAQAGVDYTLASGTLTFASGESSKTVNVKVLDDSHDEGEETLTLGLSNPSEDQVTDGEATGTIENTDPLPRALLARFGRATVLQMMEQVEERLEASRAPGFRGRFAGRELRRGAQLPEPASVHCGSGRLGYDGRAVGSEQRRASADGSGRRGRADGIGVRVEPRDGRGRERLVLEPREGVAVQRPGRRAVARRRSPDDDVRGGLREGAADGGADALAPAGFGRLSGGRRGRGGLVGHGAPPWVGYQLTERVTLWGVTGYGRGSLSLTPGEALSLPMSSLTSPISLKGGLSMSMLAGGVRGDLVDSGVGGFGLAFKADALWVGTGARRWTGRPTGWRRPRRW